MTDEDSGRQFKTLTAGTVTDSQVLRILRRKIEGMRRADEERRLQTFTLINAVLLQRHMQLPQDLFLEVFRVCVLDPGCKLFDLFAMYFASYAKNGHRAQALQMLQEERIRLRNLYQTMGGRDEKQSLRERLEVLRRRPNGRVRQGVRSSVEVALACEFEAFVEIENAVSRIDGLARR